MALFVLCYTQQWLLSFEVEWLLASRLASNFTSLVFHLLFYFLFFIFEEIVCQLFLQIVLQQLSTKHFTLSVCLGLARGGHYSLL